jgi:pimeloyl-[acyl-carrier protein] methyl ester esterase
MRNRMVLLPGWGLGVSPLEPLAAALQGLDQHLRVDIEPLPEIDSSDPREWVEELHANLPEDVWLGGWSLGGMLAAELANRRGERCCGLLTLGSNACFVARADWPSAMHGEHFDAFLGGCLTDPAAILKRFSLLCAQGADQPRPLGRLLLAGAPATAPQVLRNGLELLAQLDVREALQRFHGPQLHLFAGQDALVPGEVAGELLALLPDVEVGLIEHASHAFPVEDPHGLAAAIYAFLHERNDD